MAKYDHSLLRGKIAEKRLSQKALAEKLGINENTFSRKMSGVSDFTVSEVHMLMYLLNLDDPREYFFKK